MCGINGLVSRKILKDISVRVNNMNDALIHRGPDAGGILELVSGHIVVGQRRLSIIDLDARSNQPMLSADECETLVFNGEIYNYLELRT